VTIEVRQVGVSDGRGLHIRRLGQGPALVMMHESPRSSAVLLPLARRLADAFTVFAVDTPGYGASDPLRGGGVEIDDFADAIVGGLRALGLSGAAVYGTHTGATMAAAMAQRYAGFVAGVVLDGYPLFQPQERELHLRFYLPSFAPAWDGSHVPQLWSRVRDQYAFFPWYLPGDSARLPRDPPDPARQTAVVQDLLAAGEHYAVAYGASFRFDAMAALHGLRVPAAILCHTDDLLVGHIDRLPAEPGIPATTFGPDIAARAAAVREAFARMAISPPIPPAPRDGCAATPNGMLGCGAGLVYRGHAGGGATDAAPLLLLHDSPGGAWQWEVLARHLSAQRQVVVPELPGHGISPALPAEAEPADAAVAMLAALVRQLGWARFDLAGRGTGAALAVRLAAALPDQVGRMLLADPPRPCRSAVTALHPLREASWDGTHLFAAWMEQRDRVLYRPWCERSAATARALPRGIDVARVHRRFVAQVLAGNNDLGLAQTLDGDSMAMQPAARHSAVMLAAEDPDTAVLATRLNAGGLHCVTAPEAGLDGIAAAWLAA
jgi:pimeloyl-ACP methyl ester carboxylesterase